MFPISFGVIKHIRPAKCPKMAVWLQANYLSAVMSLWATNISVTACLFRSSFGSRRFSFPSLSSGLSKTDCSSCFLFLSQLRGSCLEMESSATPLEADKLDELKLWPPSCCRVLMCHVNSSNTTVWCTWCGDWSRTYPPQANFLLKLLLSFKYNIDIELKWREKRGRKKILSQDEQRKLSCRGQSLTMVLFAST